MELVEYLSLYPPREPLRPSANQDELRQLGAEEGVRTLDSPPATPSQRRVPEKKGDLGCHLWVFAPDGVPYILERCEVAADLESGVVKHTNLTGGSLAACGGELWVDPADDSKLYLNGCSGRYGPETPRALADAEAVLAARGFQVDSFGWDYDAGKPAMVLRP